MREDVDGGLKSVASALDLLECFMSDEELGVSEAARRLGVAKSTAHRLLTTLASRGFIEQNLATGKYRLGLHLFELGHLALTRVELRRQSKTLLEELREASGMTVHLAVPSGVDVLYLERLATLRGMAGMGEYRRRWPLHATSSGKAICAHDPMAAEARIAAGLPKYAAETIATEKEFRASLEAVRRRGYASSRNEVMMGLASVAAPVLDQHGFARAAVSITGSINDLEQNQDRHRRLIMAAAQRLTRIMANRPAQ